MRNLALLALAALSVPVLAAGQFVQSFTGGSNFTSFYGSAQATPDMVGYRFTANTNLFVTDLGMWIASPTNPGLDQVHRVILWDTNAASIVASAVVDSTSTVMGDWVFTAITPVALTSGTNYTIAADYWTGGLDWYNSGASSVTFDSDLSFVTRLAPTAINMGYVMPTLTATGNGRFGPNLITAAIPEPASMAVLGLGALALLRKKRKV